MVIWMVSECLYWIKYTVLATVTPEVETDRQADRWVWHSTCLYSVAHKTKQGNVGTYCHAECWWDGARCSIIETIIIDTIIRNLYTHGYKLNHRSRSSSQQSPIVSKVSLQYNIVTLPTLHVKHFVWTRFCNYTVMNRLWFSSSLFNVTQS